MKSPSFLFLLLFNAMFILNTNAQQYDKQVIDTSVYGFYQKETIYLRNNSYVKNNKAYPVGFLGNKLKKEMWVSPEALTVFEKSQNQRIWALVCTGVFTAGTVVAIANVKTSTYEEYESLQDGLLVASVAVIAVTIPLVKSANKNVNKAVWIRNRDVLSKK